MYLENSSLDCTCNYWGNNTAEIKEVGASSNLSFIYDYFDERSKSMIDLTGYREQQIKDIGYKERKEESSTEYKIGDIIEFKKENLTMAMYMADYGMMIPLKEWHHDP